MEFLRLMTISPSENLREEKKATMTLVDFLILGVVAAICGMLSQLLVGYSIGGCITSAVIGYIGTFIGA